MTREEIISGLEFTVEMFLLDPSTGETISEPKNDMDKTTIDACRGAIGLLKQEPRWIPVSQRLPEELNYCLCCDKDGYITIGYIPGWSKEWIFEDDDIFIDVTAWMPLPEPYKPQESEVNDG